MLDSLPGVWHYLFMFTVISWSKSSGTSNVLATVKTSAAAYKLASKSTNAYMTAMVVEGKLETAFSTAR